MNDEELLAFHDGPANLSASASATPLVQRLAERGILRLKLVYARPSFISRLSKLLRIAGDA
jgi:hypothetical protein